MPVDSIWIQATPPQHADLFLLDDLDKGSRTELLAESDFDALRAIADWIKRSSSDLTRISGAPDPYAPSCLWPWNVKASGWLLSALPTVVRKR